MSAGGDEAIADLMDRFAKALSAGDGAAVAQLWTVPAFVLYDGGARPVATIEEVEAFFSNAKEQYAARGIDEARPEIQAIDWMTSQLANVTVRWPYIDQAGKEIGEESSTYTVRQGEKNTFKIQVVVMHGEKKKAH